MMVSPSRAALEEAARAHERYLWGVCYRMTGSSADAEDLVQETFTRALVHPPARADEPLRPWLTAVAINLAKDHLRRRRREPYQGPWLPSPIETADEASPPSVEVTLADGSSTEGRYDLLESVSLAFLVALEELTPQQRAVLLLCDVFDYSVKDAARCLGLSESNVKTTHHRARKAMAAYDQDRCIPTRAVQERTRQALEQLMGSLLAGDVAGIEAMLSQSVRALSDGGSEFYAAKVPVLGPSRVATFSLRVTQLRGAPAWAEVRMLNGLPALLVSFAHASEREAPHAINMVRLDAQGRIAEIYSVLATDKLTGVKFPALEPAAP